MGGPTKVWKGFITFGLLQFPVYLNVGAREKKVEMHNYHVGCNSGIELPKTCRKCQRKLAPNEIYRGFEAGPDNIVPLTQSEIDAISPATERTMDIAEIVPLADIDPVYLAESFYVLPDVAGGKAYSLLVQTLHEKRSAAIVQVTKNSREHMAVLRPMGHGLMLHYLWYEDEIAHVAEFDHLQPVAVSAAELKLAKQLAESIEVDFRPDTYEDSYRQRLNTLIASKIDKGVKPPAPVNAPSQVPTVDMAAALMASLGNLKPHRSIKPADAPPQAIAKPAKKKGGKRAA